MCSKKKKSSARDGKGGGAISGSLERRYSSRGMNEGKEPSRHLAEESRWRKRQVRRPRGGRVPGNLRKKVPRAGAEGEAGERAEAKSRGAWEAMVKRDARSSCAKGSH